MQKVKRVKRVKRVSESLICTQRRVTTHQSLSVLRVMTGSGSELGTQRRLTTHQSLSVLRVKRVSESLLCTQRRVTTHQSLSVLRVSEESERESVMHATAGDNAPIPQRVELDHLKSVLHRLRHLSELTVFPRWEQVVGRRWQRIARLSVKWCSQSVSQSISQSASQSISQSASQPASQSVRRRILAARHGTKVVTCSRKFERLIRKTMRTGE
jgi:hypothetical protein